MAIEKWLVSILICTYNAEKTIKRTIDSCLNQTYKNFEILIHDDQSKDKTIEVINNMRDKRIKIIESWKKLWPYKWLNFLLDYAKWDYIAIQDHDDIRHPQKIEMQVEFLENNKKYVGCWTNYLEYYAWDEKWFICESKKRNVSFWIAHTSLIFRNEWYRYNTENDYMCDVFFVKYILTKWKELIHVIPKILTLHYNKSDWKNYSNLRFKYNIKNFKRYISINWCGIKSIIYLIFFSWFKWANSLIKKLMIKKNMTFSKEELMRHPQCMEMVKYLQ